MKIKEYGYKVKNVEVREMTIAELKLSIIEGYVRMGVNHEVVLMDITGGECETFYKIEDVTRNEWSGNCKIEVIGTTHGYGTEKEHKTIILFQIAEDGERVIE